MGYPLYTYELCGQSYRQTDNHPYEMVIITQWSSREENAKEVCHKTYYFDSYPSEIKTILSKEKELESIFKEPEYTVFEILSAKRKEILVENQEHTFEVDGY